MREDQAGEADQAWEPVECQACAYYRARRTRQCRHPHAVQGDGRLGTYTPPDIRNQDKDCADFRRLTVGQWLLHHLPLLLGLSVVLQGLRIGLYYGYRWLGLL